MAKQTRLDVWTTFVTMPTMHTRQHELCIRITAALSKLSEGS
jgi:hypothetical protein